MTYDTGDPRPLVYELEYREDGGELQKERWVNV
jgi:hypothetical protein